MLKGTRTCAVCKSKKNQKELLRMVVKNNQLQLDENQTEQMRGVYICKKRECTQKLLKLKDISRVLKISATNENVTELVNVLEEKISWEK